MALQIKARCREIVPDCDDEYLSRAICSMAVECGLAAAVVDINSLEIAEETFEQFTQIVVESLLTNGYQTRDERAQAEAEQERESQRLGIPQQSDLETVVDDFIEERNYERCARELLRNAFPWFYLNGLDRSFRDHNSNFTQTFQALLQVVQPYVGDFDLKSLNPTRPVFPREIRYHLKNVNSNRIGKYQLLCTARPARYAGEIQSKRLRNELASFLPNGDSIGSLASTSTAGCSSSQSVTPVDNDIECQCCFEPTVFESLTQCTQGHLFCQMCLIEYVKNQIEIGVKSGYLECMENGCSASILRASLKCVPEAELKRLDERIAAFNVNASGIEGLVRCPHCQMQFELEKEAKALHCYQCGKVHCRECLLPWADHAGKTCKEMKKFDDKETELRRLYEERMSNAVIRKCPRCHTGIVKTDGCNKMKCQCGGTICYICRTPNIDYSHFCNHARDPGKGCVVCKKCSLWEDAHKKDKKTVEKLEAESSDKQSELRQSRDSRKRCHSGLLVQNGQGDCRA